MTAAPDAPSSAADGTIVRLTHGRVTLALHHLRGGSGRPLLLLHGLGEHAPGAVPGALAGWPGPVWGLDFTGHGQSSVPRGGGYTAEILMADVDAALEHLGPVTLYGRGLGAYVALLAAGGRPTLVRGAVLADGVGLAGGGGLPGTPAVVRPSSDRVSTPDPFALAELAKDVRPPDYATTYVRLALQFSGLETPVAVSAVVRPGWLAAVVDEPGVVAIPLAEALVLFADPEL